MLLLLCSFAVVACERDGGDAGQKELPGRPVNAKLRLMLSLNNGMPVNPTRGETSPGYDGDPNSVNENKITSLTFFVIDYNGALNWARVSHVTLATPSLSTPSTVDVEVKTTTGTKYIYVGANMTGQQIASFYSNGGRFTSAGTTYSGVMSDFVDMDRGITMFGQIFTESSYNNFDEPAIEIAGSNTTPIAANLELSRVVSKVALTYVAGKDASGNSNNDYVMIADEIAGTIRADNVFFMLNNTRKSIDFIAGMDDSYSGYAIADYLTYNDASGSLNPRLYYYIAADPTTDFIFYTPEASIFKLNGSSISTPEIDLPEVMYISGDYPYYEGLKEYQEINPGEDHGHYSSSLYCLENVVNKNGFSPADKVLDVRHGINTKVVVAAKYTPEKVMHTNNPSTPPTLHSITTEADMDAITDNEGTFHAVLKGVSSSGLNLYDYYTSDARTYLETHLPLEDLPAFITYEGGYGYYATFISQPDTTNPIAVADDDKYNMYRNNYYILRVIEFNPPGAVYPQDIYMLVNSQTIEWGDGGPPTNIIVE